MRYFIFMILFFSPFIVFSKTIITYAGEEKGPRYLRKLLELVLENTKAEFGDFELVSTDQHENYPRLIGQLDKGVYENFVMKVSVTDEILNKYNVVKFPLDRGTTGYRIAFSSQSNEQKKCDDININYIAEQLTVQGLGWLDTDILKYNNFNVYTVGRNQQMFEMIKRKRARYFFRGINELPYESSKFPNHFIEPCFALKYPLPRFFITNKRDVKIAKRIEIGLKMAFKDGSFIKLWRKYYIEKIRFANMKERQIFELENPFITTLGDEYLQYNFKFSELNDY